MAGAPGSTLTIKYRTSDPAAASARSKFATVMKNLEGDFPFSNFFMQKLLLRRALTPEGRPYLLKDSDGNQNGNYEAVLCGHDDQVTLTISPSKEGAVASTAGRSTQRQKPSIHTPRGLGKNVQSVSAQDGGDALASTTQSFSLGIKVIRDFVMVIRDFVPTSDRSGRTAILDCNMSAWLCATSRSKIRMALCA